MVFISQFYAEIFTIRKITVRLQKFGLVWKIPFVNDWILKDFLWEIARAKNLKTDSNKILLLT